jgi:hypothetical protein
VSRQLKTAGQWYSLLVGLDYFSVANHPILAHMVTLHLIPEDIAADYEVHEWRNATGILQTAHLTPCELSNSSVASC